MYYDNFNINFNAKRFFKQKIQTPHLNLRLPVYISSSLDAF